MRLDFSIKGNALYIPVMIILFCHITLLWGCTQNKIRKEAQIAKMTDTELLAHYHALGERIRDMEMRHRMDKQLNRSYFEHDIVLDLSVDGKIYKLEQQRKMILKELQKRQIEPGCN